MKGANNANKKSFDEKKDLKLFRWSKEREFRFPIRPPKLRKVSPSSEGLSQKSRIGYASALQTRQTDNSTLVSPIRKVRKVKRKRLDSRPNNQVSHNSRVPIACGSDSRLSFLCRPIMISLTCNRQTNRRR